MPTHPCASAPLPHTPIRGITLIELLVGLAVVAILLTVGVPSFTGLLSQWRQQAAIDTFVADIHLARSSARRTSRPVFMCALDAADANRCTASPQWTAGWIVFADANGNNAFDVGETEIARRAAPGGLAVLVQENSAAQLVFRADGSLRGISARVTVQASGGRTDAQRVILNSTGRARVGPDAP